MAFYDYKCSECGCIIEVEHSIKDEPNVECPNCLKQNMVRLISSRTSFVLKGDGWFKDGYSSPPPSDTKKNSDRAVG